PRCRRGEDYRDVCQLPTSSCRPRNGFRAPVECAVPVPSDGVALAARGHTFFIGSMALYAATIFVSAFLLFLVQPIMAKQILPWFGGSANVWTTCLVFFQATLLLG